MRKILTAFISIIMFAEGKTYPEILLIPDFSYVYRNISDELYKNLYIPGLLEEITHIEHSEYNGKRGFNFNYLETRVEQTLNGFHFYSIFHLTENSFNIDEIYLEKYIKNLKLKGGKFRSEIGILNVKHQHAWFFIDFPLIYKVFFGNHGLTEKGIHIDWFSKVSKLGIELLQGENENSFGYKSIPELGIPESQPPSLISLFTKIKFNNLTGSLFYLHGKRRNDNDIVETGTTNLIGVGIQSDKPLYIKTELFYRKISGTFYNPEETSFNKKQAGYYFQIIIPLNKYFLSGFRYDNIFKNSLNSNSLTGNLEKYSFGINYFPKPDFKIRFQISKDRSSFIGEKRKELIQITGELTLFIGSHSHGKSHIHH